ncbi:MAG: NAD-dependent epimerase/dehydratase family protein [Planctomycetota bacterium]
MKTPENPSSPSGSQENAAVLITGAGGEVGHGLIRALSAQGHRDIVAIDIRELDAEIRELCVETFVGDICDEALLGRLMATFEVYEIFHLAALLSTRGESSPELAHDVNVGGTIQLLKLAAQQASASGSPVRFVFPSSIAAYGIPDLATKVAAGAVHEDQHLEPITMYGCNKLYCEHLGRYYSRHYRLLAKDRVPDLIDFRAVRFPGLISADTVPSGGTSDYAPEMIHAGAKGEPYACFVRADAQIPFMTMPDAIDALLALAAADREKLTRLVYNLGSFAPTAGEIAHLVEGAFPGAQITFAPDTQRQAIVDSWPADVDDGAARRDWGFAPRHDLAKAFDDYLVPSIRARYAR